MTIPQTQKDILERTVAFLRERGIVALAGPRGSNPDQLISEILKKLGYQPIMKSGAFDPENKKFSFYRNPVQIQTDCGSLLENRPLPRPINVPVVLTTMTERQRIAGFGKFLLPSLKKRTISQLMTANPSIQTLPDSTITLEKLESINKVPPALLKQIGVVETENNIGFIATNTLIQKERETPSRISEVQRPLFLETLYAQSPLFQDHTRFPHFSETIKNATQSYHRHITERDWDKDYPNKAFLGHFIPRTHNRVIKRPVPQFREALIEKCEQHKLLCEFNTFNSWNIIPQVLEELKEPNTPPERQHLRDFGLLFDKNRGGTSVRRRKKKTIAPPLPRQSQSQAQSQSSTSSPV